MTLILTLGNREQFIQLSDRRLTAGGNSVDEESNKAAVLFCANARLLCGFSGLAKVGDFSMDRWLLDSLYECGAPDFTAYNILERIRLKATNDFNSIPEIKALPKESKKLSIIFSGYLYAHSPPLGAYAMISNFEDFKDNVQSNQAWDKFISRYWKEKRPIAEEYSLVQRIGIGQAINANYISILRNMLIELKPAKAIIEKGVDIFRSISRKIEAQGAIGKQISSLCVPNDINKGVTSGYYSNHPSQYYYMPNSVFNYSHNRRSVFAETIACHGLGKNHPPIVVQKVRKNAPCPCESGLKYKDCHGQ